MAYFPLETERLKIKKNPAMGKFSFTNSLLEL
jgi:hypothetical protein